MKCGISCGMAGWYTERHPKLDPVATMTDGVFVAGVCQGPKDIPDTVAQASAVAARALEGAMTGRGLQSLASLSLSDIEARAKSLVTAS
jgi:heterodisulfide reductase subunit A